MRISLSEALERTNQQDTPKNYIKQFMLKEDEATFLRFLVDDINDINVCTAHKVRMTSKAGKQYSVMVDCIGKDCPLCKEAPNHVAEAYPQIPLVTKAKDIVTIPLINFNNGAPEYQILAWSVFIFKKINPMLSRIKPLSSTIEIQRTGKAVETNYFAYPADDKPELAGTVDELKKKFDVKDDDATGRFDSLIREWTASQMEEYLTTGTYPHSATATTAKPSEDVEAPVRRTNYGF